MKTKYTPGKLHVCGRRLHDEEGRHIFSCHEYDDWRAQVVTANLALRWNCHPDLVEALQLCVKLLSTYPCHDPNGERCGNMVPDKARAALVKAGIVEGGI